jgi:hypothetical protein
MPDFPHSLVEFQSRFRDEGACVMPTSSLRAGRTALSVLLVAATKPGGCKPKPGLGNAPAAASRPR